MARSYMQNFTRDNGYPISVEYTFEPGSETTYSPMYGACGGDGCEVEIVDTWPNTAAYVRHHALQMRFKYCRAEPWWIHVLLPIGLPAMTLLLWFHQRYAALTDAEYERFESWLIENHVYEPDYSDMEYDS